MLLYIKQIIPHLFNIYMCSIQHNVFYITHIQIYMEQHQVPQEQDYGLCVRSCPRCHTSGSQPLCDHKRRLGRRFGSQLLVRQRFPRRLQEGVGGKTQRQFHCVTPQGDTTTVAQHQEPGTTECTKTALGWSSSLSPRQLNSSGSRTARNGQTTAQTHAGGCAPSAARQTHCNSTQFNPSTAISSYTPSWAARWP